MSKLGKSNDYSMAIIAIVAVVICVLWYQIGKSVAYEEFANGSVKVIEYAATDGSPTMCRGVVTGKTKTSFQSYTCGVQKNVLVP